MDIETIIKNVRKNQAKDAIGSLFAVAIFTVVFFDILNKGEEFGGRIFYLVLFGVLAVGALFFFINSIGIIINPLKSDLFKKYGSPEKVKEILNEIKNDVEFVDKNLVVSKNYITDSGDFSKLVACDDVLGIHKLVHKTNFITDYFQIVIVDKYGFQITYRYEIKEEDKCDKILMMLATKCKNAKVGYTKDEQENIRNNMEKLPKE